MKIGDMRRADVQRYVTARCGGVSAGSVAREMNILKRLFTLCVEWELIVVNPAAGVKLPRVPAGRLRYLQPTELQALMEASPPSSSSRASRPNRSAWRSLARAVARGSRTSGSTT